MPTIVHWICMEMEILHSWPPRSIYSKAPFLLEKIKGPNHPLNTMPDTKQCFFTARWPCRGFLLRHWSFLSLLRGLQARQMSHIHLRNQIEVFAKTKLKELSTLAGGRPIIFRHYIRDKPFIRTGITWNHMNLNFWIQHQATWEKHLRGSWTMAVSTLVFFATGSAGSAKESFCCPLTCFWRAFMSRRPQSKTLTDKILSLTCLTLGLLSSTTNTNVASFWLHVCSQWLLWRLPLRIFSLLEVGFQRSALAFL